MALATPVTLGTCWGKAASAAVNLSSFIRYHEYRYDDYNRRTRGLGLGRLRQKENKHGY
jgi:hypothetical protein